jgi:hypothetical protein
VLWDSPAGAEMYMGELKRCPYSRQMFPESRQMFPKSRQRFPESRQMFPESRQMFPESRQMFPESRQFFLGELKRCPFSRLYILCRHRMWWCRGRERCNSWTVYNKHIISILYGYNMPYNINIISI